MLIKMQKHRLAKDFMVIEGARHVTYSDRPTQFHSEEDLKKHMHKFITESHPGRRSVWYCSSHDSDMKSDKPQEWPNGYGVNSLSFTNSDNEGESILFDGEAFICNDEGKTIHRVRRGGPTGAPA